MAAAGPAMSLLLAGAVLSRLRVRTQRRAGWWVTAPLRYLATINLFVGVFNLLPGFPLDGGRVLRSILWAVTGDILKATQVGGAQSDSSSAGRWSRSGVW